MRVTRLAGLGLLLFALSAPPASGQSADNVLLVINAASPDSVAVGEYYALKRTLPDDHIVRLAASTNETIQRPEYESTIEAPIAAWLTRHALQDTILYVVLTKGVPIRVAGTVGRDGTTASVDSELSLLYRKMVGMPTPRLGRVENPYFLGNQSVGDAKRFTRFESDLYLVTRLDGFTVDDVRGLIDRGLSPARNGQIVLDRRGAAMNDAGGDRWLLDAADRLEAATDGGRVILEDSPALATTDGPVLGYYSWGSNDPANQQRRAGLQFVNGAIGGMFVSTDGRTFIEPPVEWAPGPSIHPPGLFGSGSQSLAADLVREGLTGMSAHVDEPYLDGTIRPQILFPAYLAGFTLAESYYLALPYLSWQTIIIGDPLCAPYLRSPLAADELSMGIDPETALPGLFSDRRLSSLAEDGLNIEALKLLLKADVHRARNDLSGTETVLGEAVALEPRLTVAAIQLAAFNEERGEFAEAAERYRQIVAVEPRNVVALNNLAFALAVHLNSPEEALPFAELAARVSPVPAILDTLGWTHHLLGNHRAAAPLLERALAGSTDNVDILLHAATVHAELGELATARRELDAAIRLAPHIGDRQDVRALRERIGLLPGAPA